MKPKHLFTGLLAATALFVASCSTSRMGQNVSNQDDVYNSNARAMEYVTLAPLQNKLPVDSIGETSFDYGKSDPYYDMSYASRIDRFYYGDRWRTYFDNYYDLNGYNNFYGSFGLGFDRFYNYGNHYGFGFYPYYGFSLGWGGYFGSYYNSWSPWGYYGNYWGPYSYYPNYGGYYGGGFYGGGGVFVGRSRNNNPRPIRGGENGVNRPNGTYMGGAPSRGDNNSYRGTRSEMYNPSNARPSRGTETGNTTRTTEATRPTRTSDMPIGRPSRGNDAPPPSSSSRPTRGNDSPPPSRPSYTPPPTQSAPPPSSSGGGSRGSSSSSGGGGGRPTRG